MSAIEELNLTEGTVAVLTAPSIDERETRTNEDSVAVVELSDGSLVLAVADGAGAHRGGAEASRIAINTLTNALKEISSTGRWEGILLHAIESAHKAILKLGIGAASTFIVAHICDKGVRTFHVGDSQALVTGQRGKLKFETVPHSPVGYAQESGMLDEEEALGHESRNIISNALGADTMHTQVSGRLPLASRDTLILASDGLFDNLRLEEIVTLVRKGKSVECIERLVSKATKRMLDPDEGQPSKLDDLSIIVFRRNVSKGQNTK
jgi:serine/threonine protein phosphatase PrpC